MSSDPLSSSLLIFRFLFIPNISSISATIGVAGSFGQVPVQQIFNYLILKRSSEKYRAK
jgi:hypothetical protein